MTTRVRLQDVARRAGVSIKTVSNVVNGTGSVTPGTREKVEAALRELRYRPNLAARHLRRGSSGLIAVALPELTQPYFAELASELVRAAKVRGRTVLLSQTDGTEEAERGIVDGVDLPVLDGVVLSPLAIDAQTLTRRTDTTPLVLLGEHVTGSDSDHVTVDNRRAGADATAHLLALGRRRVAALGAQVSGPRETAVLRLEGYRTALAESGVPFREELVATVEQFHRADGARAMDLLLDLPEPPDAVFCFNDALALGALHALYERGLSAPEDVAVVGVDDVEEGRFSSPTLTTVAPDKPAIARTALDLLLRDRPPGGPPRSVTVDHTLMVRESTAAPTGRVPRNRAGAATPPPRRRTAR